MKRKSSKAEPAAERECSGCFCTTCLREVPADEFERNEGKCARHAPGGSHAHEDFRDYF